MAHRGSGMVRWTQKGSAGHSMAQHGVTQHATAHLSTARQAIAQHGTMCALQVFSISP